MSASAAGLTSAEAVAEDTADAAVALGEVPAGKATPAVSSGLVGVSQASSLWMLPKRSKPGTVSDACNDNLPVNYETVTTRASHDAELVRRIPTWGALVLAA
jgi:hypothetical protein